jgi:hypothetical protein
MARPRHLALVERYSEALDARDALALRSLRAPSVTARWPQTGEIAFGRDAIERVEAVDPDRSGWDHTIAVTSLGPDELVVELARGDAGGPIASRSWRVVRMGLDGDTIAREVVYVAEPFEPPAFRAAFVDRYDPLAESPDLSEPALDDGIDREVLDGWVRGLTGNDMSVILPMSGPDWQGEYPQSGERFPSTQALIDAHVSYPGGLPREGVVEVAGPADEWVLGPSLPLKIHGSGACWMAEIVNDYPDGSRSFQVVVTRLRRGRMHRTRWYWCTPSEPPAWRADLTDRYDPLEPAGGPGR